MTIYNNYPKFHIAVDCVIFTYDEDQLKVLLYPRNIEPHKGDWSLMGGFVDEAESFEDAARRVLMQTVGLSDIFLEQVQGFSKPDREPDDRVISMAFYALIPSDRHNSQLIENHHGRWWPLNNLPTVVFDHNDMITCALSRLQHKASCELIGQDLLPKRFTFTQLNNLYNAIFQRNFDQSNFRKKVSGLKTLIQTADKDNSNSKRGAYLYMFPQKQIPWTFHG